MRKAASDGPGHTRTVCPGLQINTAIHWIQPRPYGGRATRRSAMAVNGPFKVECGDLFPHGLGVVGAVTQLDDFDASTKEKRVQARDKESGLPVWQVEVMDFDPEARERVFKVKIAAAVQPVPPEPVAGAPVRPV